MTSKKKKSRAKSSNSQKASTKLTLFQMTKRLVLIGIVFTIGLIIYSDAEIQAKFATNRWLVPAKVYAKPLVLVEGETIEPNRLIDELVQLGYTKSIKADKPGMFEQYNNEFIIFARPFDFHDAKVPSRQIVIEITKGKITRSRIFSDSSEQHDGYLRLEPVLIGRVNPLVHEDRTLVKLSEVPVYLIDALIASEDRDFYDHWGVSIRGIARAFSRNLSEGKIAQGGSTLTQQLIKNYFLTNERTIWRKVREIFMAITLEARYQKDEILQAYINEVYLGQNGQQAIHGFAKASEFYFGQSLSDLNLSQVATLVALVRGPSYYDPRRHPERAKERRNRILAQMTALDRITEQQELEAAGRSLQVVDKPTRFTIKMPAVMGLVRQQLQQNYTIEQLNHDDLSVFTSIDLFIQKNAEQAVKKRIDWLQRMYRKVPDELQSSLVISDRFNGEILAIVGDSDPEYAGFNRAVHAYRQTGSVIKPFVYLTALQRASEFHWMTTLDDRSFSLTATDGSLWTPKNYDGEENGEVYLKDALVRSLNLSTARLAMQVGIDQVVETLYQAGFKRELFAFPSLALGAQEMSPLELLKLYQVLSSEGLRVESTVVRQVTDNDGQLLDRFPVTAYQEFTPESIYLVNRLLQQVVQNGTASTLSDEVKRLRVAGKTGTTNDLKDSWFAGFSQHYLAVSWIGMDDNSTTGLTGSTGAMEIWEDFIQRVESEPLRLNQPSGIVDAKDGWFGDCFPFVMGELPGGYDAC